MHASLLKKLETYIRTKGIQSHSFKETFIRTLKNHQIVRNAVTDILEKNPLSAPAHLVDAKIIYCTICGRFGFHQTFIPMIELNNETPFPFCPECAEAADPQDNIVPLKKRMLKTIREKQALVRKFLFCGQTPTPYPFSPDPPSSSTIDV